jgi:transaldolase
VTREAVRSPDLLRELAATDGEVPRRLDPGAPGGEPAVHLDEPAFRWALNDDAMATEKLAEGIRNFARDTERLESLVADPAFQERAAS